MDEQNNQPYTDWMPPRRVIPMGKREQIFALAVFLCAALLMDGLVYHGAQLGFAAGAAGLLLSAYRYLKSSGRRADPYSAAMLALSIVIIGAFPRSDDGVLKFLAVCAMLVIPGLALCLMSGHNRHDPRKFPSLFEGIRVLFTCGFGEMEAAGRGIREAVRRSGKVGKTSGAAVLGLLIALPVVAVLVMLLMSADAAFEGLLELLPDFKWHRILVSLLLGAGVGYLFYTRTAALQHLTPQQASERQRKGLPSLTVNIVLIATAAVYLAYLVSQLAYFVGGFAGILPEGYTMAEYARRGFFEMGWLCAVNLGLIAGGIALVSAHGKVSGLTRMLCLFLGLVTLFLVATASAKMLLYIESYGLTRLRILTEVFMVWLGLTTVFVCIWLFKPRMGYMKQAVLLALFLCAVLLWADVDTCVARYNVRAYQKGRLETVDLNHLEGLSDSAVPYLAELTQDGNKRIAWQAKQILTEKAGRFDHDADLRGWNWAKRKAWDILKDYRVDDSAPDESAYDELLYAVSDTVGVDVTDSTVLTASETYAGFHGDGEITAKLILRNETAADIEAAVAMDPGWQQVPMPEEIRQLCDLFADEQGNPLVPDVKKGAYFFCDRHSQSADPHDYHAVHQRASYNFTLVVYNANAQMLYFMELDT